MTLDLDRSFFVFETSPHCEIVPSNCSQYPFQKTLEAWNGFGVSAISLGSLTVSNAINGCHQVTVSLLQRKNDVFVRPVREHLLDGGDCIAILLLQLAYFAVILN